MKTPSCFLALSLALVFSPPLAHAYNYTLLRQMAGTNSKFTNTMGSCGAMAIGWVRTVFHDFATFNANTTTGGLDASILTETEANIDDNGDIRGGGNIQFFRTWALQNPSVSAADWIVLGGMVALRLCGGPDLTPQFRPGRVDAFTPNDIHLLPNKDMTLPEIHTAFARMNFTQPEYLTLVLGSHSLGGVNMTSGSPGFGKSPPHAFDSTPYTFDNSYFVNAIDSQTNANVVSPYWLPSDKNIGTETGAASIITSYAAGATGNNLFKQRYGDVFMKMVDMGHKNLGCPLSGAGCTPAQMADSAIANPISSIPSSWVPAGYQGGGGPVVVQTAAPTAVDNGKGNPSAAAPGFLSDSLVPSVVLALVVCLSALWFA